ncbi:FliM/FliN family flagellar motor C-terminal domain-containing protein [Xanthomonas cucurbitae]|uniref:FliM/FliN family flagellar motor C-terminal domain-containing protein n=1 Tax=Xanthomonas cucurbitae TaxID=56453 RepID=A0ABY7YD21_9XANT|nr:FliM/FliN family flagellar motor C-terminal domain-containing protein [Xanthomonas cucurbitae]WDM67833.1 FliM/FliN family flagellar motor C-terminal domain-containing protein [Xanthomonas cucurbitae]WDM71707.1 FliM/FliN family flagellar motor C-terminal domain-containing protein [Xanthomonas cucurbitae]
MKMEANTVARDLSIFGHVKARLVADVGHVELTVDEIMSLKKSDIVPLDASCDALVTLMLNGKPVATGELMAVGEKLAVRIQELL